MFFVGVVSGSLYEVFVDVSLCGSFPSDVVLFREWKSGVLGESCSDVRV